MVDRLSYPVTGDHHLSDGWEDHIARGSLGGVDFPVPYGTPVYATHDGFLSVDNSSSGSGGRVATVQGGGITDQCLHMSSFVRGNGDVSRGEHIGYSGASAYGSDWGTGGPHVHWHAIINGIRVNPLNYLTTTAGDNITPIEGDDNMPDAATTEQIVRDQVRFLAKNDGEFREAIKSIVVDAFKSDGWGKVSQTVNEAVTGAVKTLTSRLQREARLRLYRNKESGLIFAFDPETGEKRDLKDAAEIDVLKRLQIVGLDEQVVEISQSDEDYLLADTPAGDHAA